jgi:hypothetical protein
VSPAGTLGHVCQKATAWWCAPGKIESKNDGRNRSRKKQNRYSTRRVKSTCKHSAHNRIPNRKRAGLQRVRRSSAGSGQCSLHSSSGPQDQARRPKFLAAKQHKKLDLQPDNKQQGNTTVFRNEIQRHEPAAAEKITLGSGTCAARASSAGRLPWAPKTKNRKIWATEEAH